MDNFGFETQGKYYNQFRPKYPACLYEYTIKKIKSRNKYLDVAMGTGQLLFNISPQFSWSKGIDISEKMLNTANQQLQSIHKDLKQKILIEKRNVMELSGEQEKYDLITIGQALHWFPVRQALFKLKGLLQPQSKLLVLSYVMKQMQDKHENEMFEKFYSKVKPLFDFDRDELHNHYTNKEKYPFDQLFPQVVRYSQQVKVSMPRNAYIGYLKTFSGYNQYLLKKGNEPNPLAQIQKEQNKEVTLIFDFFKVQCGL